MASDDEPFLKPGGRNLLILCLIGIVMAVVSTSIIKAFTSSIMLSMLFAVFY